MTDIRIGISGWTYGNWHGDFYPEDLPKRKELEYAGRIFNSIEVNGSFYTLIKPDTWRRYYEQTPPGFLFAVKGSRFITHTKKLKDIKTPLANFFASGFLELREKLGPILWQFSARGPEKGRYEAFLELLPKNTKEAAELAKHHDHRLSGRASTRVDRNRRIRHAFEIRDEKLFVPEFVRLIRRHGVALVFSDSGKWPYIEEITGGFVYLRLHGSPHTYASRYSDKDLDRWADSIRRWTSGSEPDHPERITDRKPPQRKTRDAYVYFDNDYHGHAPHDACRLMARLGVKTNSGKGHP
ncbi:MAG: DUF72 domain-containing protein [Desulfobacterales bacterium]